MNLISPNDSPRDNEYLQLAESLKYSAKHGVRLAELRPGLFAVYSHEAKPLYVGEDWDEVLTHFRSRPTYNKPAPMQSKAKTRAENTAELLAALAVNQKEQSR